MPIGVPTPADAAAVHDPQQQRDLHAVRIEFLADRQGNRQQHQAGRHVGDPHAQHGGRDHKTQNKLPSGMAAEQCDHPQRQATVHTTACHRGRQYEATEEKQDQWTAIGGTDLVWCQHADQRQCCQRQQRGCRYWNRLEDPPDGTQAGDRRRPRHCCIEPGCCHRKPDSRRNNGTCKQGNSPMRCGRVNVSHNRPLAHRDESSFRPTRSCHPGAGSDSSSLP